MIEAVAERAREGRNRGWDGPIVLVSGWSFTSSMWNDVVMAYAAQGGDRSRIRVVDWLALGYWVFDGTICPRAADLAEDTVNGLAQDNSLWVGWSLGGVLILEAIARGKLAPRRAVLLSASPRFLQDEATDWPGMPEKNWRALRRQVGRAPRTALAGFDAWLGLPSGVARQEAPASLQQGLDWLAAIDRRDELHSLTQPIDWIYGADDPVLPARLRFDAPATTTQRWLALPDCGHDLPWSQQRYLVDILLTGSAFKGA